MNIKRAGLIIGIIFGAILALLGLLWFLQGADIVHIQPILCVANCQPITGVSPVWQMVGAIAFLAGTLATYMCARLIKRI